MIKQIAFCLIVIHFIFGMDCRASGIEGLKLSTLQACEIKNSNEKIDVACIAKATEEEKLLFRSKLQDQTSYYLFNADSLMVAVKSSSERDLKDKPPFICCELKAFLEEDSGGIYFAKIRWKKMDEALLDLEVTGFAKKESLKISSSGSSNYQKPKKYIEDKIVNDAGIVIKEYLIPISDEEPPRTVVKYSGRNCVDSIQNCALIYVVDGESVFFMIKNSLYYGLNIDDIVFVAIYNPSSNVSNTRINEMLYGYDKKAYEDFMKFSTSRVISNIETNGIPSSRYVAGFSNGGAWALDALYDHPEKYQGAIVMSPGEWDFKKDEILKKKKIYVGSGLLERGVTKSSVAIALGFRNRGATVHELYPPSGHSNNAWLSMWIWAINDINKLK